MNLEEEERKTQLATTYVGQSSDDTRRKLQKTWEQERYDLEELLDVACRVYQNREKSEK